MSNFNEVVFTVVLLSQALLISYFLPRQILERVKFVVKNYPPDRYPRLYPVDLDRSERTLHAYRYANMFMLLVGIGLVLLSIYSPTGEWRGFDWKNWTMGYYLLQFAPLIIAATAGFTYFNLKRQPDTRTRRSAELRPRRMTDYISPGLLGAVLATYAGFVVFIAYVDTFEFDWFGGYWNIVGITGMNVFFFLMVAQTIYGKRKDPYQATEDRDRLIEMNAQALAFISIAATLYVSLSITLSAFDMRELTPIFQSLYFQVIAVFSFRAMRIDDVNFEVYKEDAVAT